MKQLWAVLSYAKYLLNSKSRYKTHSPFVYEFINEVLRNKKDYPEFGKLHEHRKTITKSSSVVETVDFGSRAGVKQYVTYIEKVGELSSKRTHSKKRLELLFRLARYFRPKQILEMGTCVGFSSLYLKEGFPEAKLTTMEGCAGLAGIADEGFRKFNFNNINLITGNFNNTLESSLKNIETIDLAFFDGNHQEKPTLYYFEKCMEKMNDDSIFVFDDIHYSPGMDRAWKTICRDPRVSFTIDVFWCGFVFFKKDIAKQNFVIRY